jgi:hypothetical protein
LAQPPSGHRDRGKDIFDVDPLRIETHREQVCWGVVNHGGNARQSGDGGAHGVRAAASHKAALSHHPCYPKFKTAEIHRNPPANGLFGKFLVWIKENLVYQILPDLISGGSLSFNFTFRAIGMAQTCIFSFTSGGIFFIILGKLANGDQAAEAGTGSGARHQGVERDEQVATHRSSGQS